MPDLPSELQEALAGQYELVRELGRGGMATVYLARDVKHNRQVAVKVLRPELSASLGAERFLKEIEIAANLTHPHILPLHDSGQADGYLYYVMPYVAGKSVRGMLLERTRLDPSVAIDIVAKVADALSYAHRQGVVHRDIKPENILLAEGHPVVADFGIAKAVSTAGGEHLTRTGFPLGTPGYMSPEQAAGLTDLDARTDVYSLACVCYEMLIGDTAGFWITEEAGRSGRFVDATPKHRDRLDRLSGTIEPTLVRAMSLRADDRYATPSAFAESLREAISPARRRYGDTEVREIMRRASEAQAEHPTADQGLTLGTVQQIGAEVGITPTRVQHAARQIEESTEEAPPDVVRKLLGGASAIVVERIVPGEMSDTEFPALLEEIRTSMSNMGHVSTLGRSLAWRTARPESGTGRDVHLTVTPRAGRTRIRVEERMSNTIGSLFGGICGGGGMGAGMGLGFGVGMGALASGVAAATIIAACLGTSYALARAIFRAVSDRRRSQLQGLVGRLADHVEYTVRMPSGLDTGHPGRLEPG